MCLKNGRKTLHAYKVLITVKVKGCFTLYANHTFLRCNVNLSAKLILRVFEGDVM